MIMTLWMIITNNQILHQLGYVHNLIYHWPLQIMTISIRIYAMMTSCMLYIQWVPGRNCPPAHHKSFTTDNGSVWSLCPPWQLRSLNKNVHWVLTERETLSYSCVCVHACVWCVGACVCVCIDFKIRESIKFGSNLSAVSVLENQELFRLSYLTLKLTCSS